MSIEHTSIFIQRLNILPYCSLFSLHRLFHHWIVSESPESFRLLVALQEALSPHNICRHLLSDRLIIQCGTIITSLYLHPTNLTECASVSSPSGPLSMLISDEAFITLYALPNNAAHPYAYIRL